MKALVVYYSFSGNNELLAKKLQKRLGSDIYRISELRKRTAFKILLDILFKRDPAIKVPSIKLAEYEPVILVAPVWNGRIASPLKSFLKMQKGNIRKYSFISLCGGGGNQKIPDELSNLLKKPPVAFCELKVADLLPPDKKNKTMYVSKYQVALKELEQFDNSIDIFLRDLLEDKEKVSDNMSSG